MLLGQDDQLVLILRLVCRAESAAYADRPFLSTNKLKSFSKELFEGLIPCVVCHVSSKKIVCRDFFSQYSWARSILAVVHKWFGRFRLASQVMLSRKNIIQPVAQFTLVARLKRVNSVWSGCSWRVMVMALAAFVVSTFSCEAYRTLVRGPNFLNLSDL